MYRVKKYYWWVIVGIGIILLVMMFWPKNKSGTNSGLEMIKPKWKDIYLPETLVNPGKVEWRIEGDLPTETAKIESEAIENETSRVAAVLKLKGINISDINREDGDLMFYYGNRNNGMWNRKSGLVQVEENITSKQQLKVDSVLEISDIKANLENILKTIDSKEVRWKDTEYKKMVYPRLVSSEEKDSDIVEFSGDWVVDGKPIRSFTNDSIKITTTRDGRIISINVYLLPKITTNGKLKIINKSTLVNTDMADIGIVNYIGGVNYELETDNIKIENVNVTQEELIYIYDGRRNIFMPYFLLTGTSVAMGPVKVEMVTGAVRE